LDNKNQKLQYASPLLKTPYPIDDIELSLVVPSFNEENRLPKMLENTIKVKIDTYYYIFYAHICSII
jgi:hypothetical protein